MISTHGCSHFLLINFALHVRPPLYLFQNRALLCFPISFTLYRSSSRSGDGNRAIVRESRHWHDVFWSAIFVIHLICLGFVLAVLGLNRFRISDRLNIDRYTQGFLENHKGLTERGLLASLRRRWWHWSLYQLGLVVASRLLRQRDMNVSVHILTTYLAVFLV